MQRAALILACFFICTKFFAQQYPYVHYTPKDGLVNSRVKKAYQDSKGRMYFLTYGGLSVYDGARFKNYTTQDGLPINIVNDIMELGEDSILLATNSNNLTLLIKGKLEPFKMKEGFCPLVNQFYLHDDNRIYVSSDFGLFLFDKNKFHELNISLLNRYSTDTDQPNLGNIAGLGKYLVITTNEMNYNRGVFLYDLKADSICDVLPSVNAYLLGKDDKNRIWISSSHQLFILDSIALQNGKIMLIAPDKGFHQAKNYSTVNVAFGKNLAWLIYRTEEFRNAEIHRIDEDGTMFRMSLPSQAVNSYIKNIFIDRENNIWLCNDGEGVLKITRSPLQVFEKPFGKSAESPLVYAFHSGSVTWYSTLTKKLFRKSINGLSEFTSNLDYSPFIFYEHKNKILARDDRNIYEAYLTSESKTLNFQKIISLPDSDLFGRKIFVDPHGAIIGCLKSGMGIWINKKMLFHLSMGPREIIEDLALDKANRLWVVRRFAETEVYNLHPDNFSNYLQLIFRFPREQMTGSVRSFVIDKNGLIWIGTRDHGLFAYKQVNNSLRRLYHFHIGNGLTDNFVTSLACDSLNNIIVGTQTGLDRIQHSSEYSYRVENISKNSNLFAYINGTWTDANNAFAYTNIGMLLQVSPLAHEKVNYLPRLLLIEKRINGKPDFSGDANLSYRENTISFFVAAPSFIDEKQITYSYVLEGSGNNRWSDTTAANTVINLTNLSAGDYKLRVKAFFPSNTYSPSELSYSFSILPPWWQTWWFRVIMGILVIGVLIMSFRFYYRRKLEKQRILLEKQQAIEKERTRIATDMHDDLGAGLSRIKFLSETIGIKKQQQQPIDEEVSSIRNYSHEMIDKMGEIVWALNEKNDSISDLLSYTRAYTVEYLAQNGIECKTEMPDNFPSVFVSGEFRRNVFLTIKEALHNVVKHSQASEVVLHMGINHRLDIHLKDNGTGFDIKSIRPFSNGLSNMNTRINELNGKIEFENSKGTLIKIQVPL